MGASETKSGAFPSFQPLQSFQSATGTMARRNVEDVQPWMDRPADSDDSASLVLHTAALGTRLVDGRLFALEQGVDGVAEVGLGDFGLFLAIIQRAGVAELPLFVQDEELRGVRRAVGTPHRLALVVAIDVVGLMLLGVLFDAGQAVLVDVVDADTNDLDTL